MSLSDLMKTTILLVSALLISPFAKGADDDKPVPPAIQTLSEALISALKSGDGAAVTACWHTPAALGKVKGAEATRTAGTAKTPVDPVDPVDPVKETEREEKRQVKNQAEAVKIVGQMRAMITKYFGEVAQIKFSKVKMDLDPDSPSDAPVYEDIDIHLLAADGAHLKITVEKAIQIEGVWKFKGELDNDLVLALPDEG